MSGIAEVLLNLGFQVSGSDASDSQNLGRLRTLGARVFVGHSAQNIGDAEVVVVSSAIQKHNPELQEARRLRVPVLHRSEMLAELMHLKKGVVITGTHGKTTTTSLVAAAIHQAGLDPTVIIGGKINALGSNAKLGNGELFVVEADESDGSFLKLTPTIAVITNIDRDHMDHYANFEEILQAFVAFTERVPFFGALCVCIDDPGVQLILPRIRRKVITYGLRPDADISATNLQPDGLSMRFSPTVFGNRLDEVRVGLPGKHNVCNALASFAVAHLLGIPHGQVIDALARFDGILHRTTVVGQHGNVTVIDDYAHNPKKIESALQAIREAYPDAFLCAVFQPHRYSRLKALGDEFSRSFSHVDKVIVTPVYAASEQPIPGITVENLAHSIRQNSNLGAPGEVVVADSLEHAGKIATTAVKTINHNQRTIVITLGAGDVPKVGNMVLEQIKPNSGED